MAEEKIDQRVTVTDSQTGPITLIGKVIIKNPARWQQATWDFLTRHRHAIALAALLELVLALVYWRFQYVYLIPLEAWALAAVLLALTVREYASWRWSRRPMPHLLFALIGTLAVAGLIGWQAWRIVCPEPFASQDFGIALADFAGGSSYRTTETSRAITGEVYNTLQQTVHSQGEGGAGGTPSGVGSAVRPLEVKRIGVIDGVEAARAHGEKIGAEIVIWGQVDSSESLGTVIRFQLLETLDRAENPDFPFVMPVTVKYTDLTVRDLDLRTQLDEIKKTVAEHSKQISSFVLGLASYLDQDFQDASAELKDADEAVQSDAVVQITSDGQALLCYYLGTAKHRLGRDMEGQDYLLEAQDLNPEEPAIPLSLAFDYRHLDMQREFADQLETAFDKLSGWLSDHPDDPTALYDLAIAHYLDNDTDSEIEAYQKIIELDPDFYLAHVGLGSAYTHKGSEYTEEGEPIQAEQMYRQAQETLSKAIDIAEETGTNTGMAFLQRARARQAAGDVGGAREDYREATLRMRQSPWPHYYYAQLLEQQNELDGALLEYEKMAELNQGKAWAYTEAGSFARRAGLHDIARDYFKKAVDADPRDSLARTYLAETYCESEDWARARAEFERAIASADRLFYPYSSYAWHLYLKSDYKKAAEMYERERASASDRMPEGDLGSLAHIYVMLGDCQKARQLYAEILVPGQHFSEDARQEAQTGLKALETGCTEKAD